MIYLPVDDTHYTRPELQFELWKTKCVLCIKKWPTKHEAYIRSSYWSIVTLSNTINIVYLLKDRCESQGDSQGIANGISWTCSVRQRVRFFISDHYIHQIFIPFSRYLISLLSNKGPAKPMQSLNTCKICFSVVAMLTKITRNLNVYLQESKTKIWPAINTRDWPE